MSPFCRKWAIPSSPQAALDALAMIFSLHPFAPYHKVIHQPQFANSRTPKLCDYFWPKRTTDIYLTLTSYQHFLSLLSLAAFSSLLLKLSALPWDNSSSSIPTMCSCRRNQFNCSVPWLPVWRCGTKLEKQNYFGDLYGEVSTGKHTPYQSQGAV